MSLQPVPVTVSIIGTEGLFLTQLMRIWKQFTYGYSVMLLWNDCDQMTIGRPTNRNFGSLAEPSLAFIESSPDLGARQLLCTKTTSLEAG